MGAAYDNELDKTLELNVVVLIGTDYYAAKEPDSGLSITSEYLQVKNPVINGVTVDVRKSNTPIGTFSFKLMEFEGSKTSSKIMLDETQFLEKDCIVYLGHITGSFDFSEYVEIARTKITSVTKIANGYSFVTKEVSNLIAQPALDLSDSLITFILAGSTTLSVNNTTDWPDSGLIRIDNEFIFYTGKDVDGQTLTGLVRAREGSIAAEHEVGAEVYLVTKVLATNPVDMILQILLSDNGDLSNHGTYDVLENGLAIAPENVNITQIEALRDEHFLGEQHDLFFYGIDNMLRHLEKTLLTSTNLRFITIDGKISLSLLDQIDFSQTVPVLDESSVIGVPTWSLTSDKVVNVIEVHYDYDEVTKKYGTVDTFKDQDSINTFGQKKTLKLLMPSVKSTLNGAFIATDRAQRMLGRLSTARGRLTVRAHFDKSNLRIGANVQVIHRYLPQQGGTLGFSDQVEVMSRNVDVGKAVVTYKLEFTSYTGIRVPFIGPSPKITNVISQSAFEIDDASCLWVGYRFVLFKDGDPDGLGNPTAGSYLPDGLRTIESIVGNVVTVNTPLTTTLENGLWVKLPDYNEASEEQKARYAFVGSNTGFFDDGSKSYQIIF